MAIEIVEGGLKNVLFGTRDVAWLNESEKYDLITAFDTIHDQAQPSKVLREIYNALRKDSNGSGANGGYS